MNQSTQHVRCWMIVVLFFCMLGSTYVQAASAIIPPSNDPQSHWVMALPKQDIVAYKGLVSLDHAGGQGAVMLYPAPGLAGFVAAIATHAAIESSIRKHEKTKLELEADKVLVPYGSVLNTFRYQDLFQDGLSRMTVPGEKTLADASATSGKGWLVQTEPVYSMTQDQSAIVLDNLVRIYDLERPGKTPVYQNAIRVISSGLVSATPATVWLENRGARIKSESAGLLAASLDIAIKDAAGLLNTNAEAKTLHYSLGRERRVERGQAITSTCNHLLIRTLRGGLMSVPLKPDADTPAPATCQQSESEGALAIKGT